MYHPLAEPSEARRSRRPPWRPLRACLLPPPRQSVRAPLAGGRASGTHGQRAREPCCSGHRQRYHGSGAAPGEEAPRRGGMVRPLGCMLRGC
eukprot:scaffold17899_cov112-Isochrysis_galbana.AAC.1